MLALMTVGRAALANSPRHSGCYGIFVEAGSNWLAGADLYEHDNHYSLSVFRYAPPVAALFTPLGILPTIVGNGLLRIANLLVFAVGIWQWQRVSFPATISHSQRAGFFLVLAAVGGNYLMDVQVNVLTAGLLLLTITGSITANWWQAAICIGLAITIKGYPVSLVLVLCLLAPGPFVWRWLVAQAGWFALPFLLQDSDYVIRQYRDWFEFGLNQRFQPGWFRDVMSLAGAFGCPMNRSEYRWLESAAAVIVAVLCLFHYARQSGVRGWNTTLALCVGWMLAFGPASEVVTYFLAAPLLAGAMLLAWCQPGRCFFRMLMTAATLLLAGTQVELLFPGPRWFEQSEAHAVAMLLFLIGISLYGFGQRDEKVLH